MISRAVINVLILARALFEWALLWPFAVLRRRKRRFVSIDLKGRFGLSSQRRLWRRRTARTYEDLDTLLEQIARSRGIEGVILRIRGLEVSLADASVLRSRLSRFRECGKRVVAHFDAAGATELVLSGAADTVLMSPAGQITLLGLKIELLFLRDLLSRLGIRAQFLHIGKYKTAANMFVRRDSSEAQREEAKRLLTQLTSLVVSLVSRDDTVANGEKAAFGETRSESPMWPFERPLFDASRARICGLIHHQAYPDQVVTRLRAEASEQPFDPLATFGDDEKREELAKRLQELPRVWVQNESSFNGTRPRPVRLRPLLRRRRSIVTVEMSGLIVDDQAEPPFGRRAPRITPTAVRRVFRDLRSASRIAGVVLAIDSRGGSAGASDLIWHEVRRLAEKKPVVAFLRSVAASGGYYIAVGAEEIIACPMTITGSIGVIIGKFSIDEVLHRAEIHSETLAGSTFSTLFSAQHPFDEAQIEALQQELRAAYKRFVSRVAIGRGLSRGDVHQLGRGRIFTGDKATAVGLVDAVGSLEDAARRVAERAGIARGKLSLEHRHLDKRGFLATLAGRGEALAPLMPPQWPKQWLDAMQVCELAQRNPILAYCDIAVSGG